MSKSTPLANWEAPISVGPTRKQRPHLPLVRAAVQPLLRFRSVTQLTRHSFALLHAAIRVLPSDDHIIRLHHMRTADVLVSNPTPGVI